MLIRKNNLRLYYTSLSLPLKITIALRWNPGKDVVKKAAECAGKACNDFLKSSAANTAVNAPDDSATPPPVNPHPMPKGPTSDPATLLVKPPGKDLLDTMPPSIKTGHVTSLKENVLGKEVSSSSTDLINQIRKHGEAHGLLQEETNEILKQIQLVKGFEPRIIALNYLLKHDTKISDQYYVAFKEILKELTIVPDKDVNMITNNYSEFFENLKGYIKRNLPQAEGPYISKNYQEYLRLIAHTNENNLERKKDLYDFIKSEKISRCFLPEDFESQIAQNKKALESIFSNLDINTLTEQEILALLHRVDVVAYPDALYYVVLNAVNAKGILVRDTYVQRESEGPKIQSKVYAAIVKENSVSTRDDILDKAYFESIVRAIETKKIIVGTIISNPDGKTLLLSGKRLHNVAAIVDPTDSDFIIIIGCLRGFHLFKRQP